MQPTAVPFSPKSEKKLRTGMKDHSSVGSSIELSPNVNLVSANALRERPSASQKSRRKRSTQLQRHQTGEIPSGDDCKGCAAQHVSD